MACLLPDQLNRMVILTSLNLIRNRKQGTSIREMLKFIRVIILGTRYEFNNRTELWATIARSKYLCAPCFGSKTGMSRGRFDDIWSNVQFSKPKETHLNEESAQYQWGLVEEFVESFNAHRRVFFKPSHFIGVDESISRWYGQRGSWIDHRPENPKMGVKYRMSAVGRPESCLDCSL